MLALHLNWNQIRIDNTTSARNTTFFNRDTLWALDDAMSCWSTHNPLRNVAIVFSMKTFLSSSMSLKKSCTSSLRENTQLADSTIISIVAPSFVVWLYCFNSREFRISQSWLFFAAFLSFQCLLFTRFPSPKLRHRKIGVKMQWLRSCLEILSPLDPQLGALHDPKMEIKFGSHVKIFSFGFFFIHSASADHVLTQFFLSVISAHH